MLCPREPPSKLSSPRIAKQSCYSDQLCRTRGLSKAKQPGISFAGACAAGAVGWFTMLLAHGDGSRQHRRG
jgi:hypothetical protein